MSTKPTAKDIKNEIAALEAAKAYAPRFNAFGDNNHNLINAQIDYLKGNIDTTADEFDELSDDERSAIQDAEEWEYHGGEAPSAGWSIFKK